MYAFPYLSRMLGAEMFARLVAMMPPPRDATPEACRVRDTLAMCMVRQMGPLRSLEEASLAITVVAADAHAHEALREASENSGNIRVVMQCRAQASLMMRTRHKAAAELEALMRNHPPGWWEDQQADQAERAEQADQPVTAQADAEPEPPAPERPAPEAPQPEPTPARVMPRARPLQRTILATTNEIDNSVSIDSPEPVIIVPQSELSTLRQAA